MNAWISAGLLASFLVAAAAGRRALSRPDREEARHKAEFDLLDTFLAHRRQALLKARKHLIDLEKGTDDARADGTTSKLLDNPSALNRLAATDLFVEKAQRVLTKRSAVMRWSGIACFTVSLGILGFGGYLAYHSATKATDAITTNEVIVVLAKTLIFGGYLTIALRLTIALGRSFFHEATILLNRRHAMRLGRLVAHRLPFEHLGVKDLELAFDWNMVSDSSFRDIDANKLTETIIGNLLNFKAVTDALKDAGK